MAKKNDTYIVYTLLGPTSFNIENMIDFFQEECLELSYRGPIIQKSPSSTRKTLFVKLRQNVHFETLKNECKDPLNLIVVESNDK